MNTNTLFDSFLETIAQDSSLLAWGTNTYSKTVKVFGNIDTRSQPGEADCPCVVVFPLQKMTGPKIEDKTVLNGMGVDCHLYDESLATHALITNISEYAGVKRNEAMRKLVETAVTGMDLGNATIGQLHIIYNNIESFPFFTSEMQFWIAEPMTLSCDPFL